MQESIAMRLSDLQDKDIINVIDGKKVGNIIDINLDNNGNLSSLVIEKKRFFFSWFTNSQEKEIKWDQIEKIGEDVILIKMQF